MKRPDVTIIIPAYNETVFISTAIESALDQEYPKERLEVIVVDDGSTDNTPARLSKYGDRIVRIHQRHSGKAIALKKGIEAARGIYIFNLDADDRFLPRKIQKVVRVFEKDRSITHIAHPAIFWNPYTGEKKVEIISDDIKGRQICGKQLLSHFFWNNQFIGGGSTFAGRADCLKKIPIEKSEIGYSIDLYLAMFCLNAGQSVFMEEPLSFYRVHAAAYSQKDARERAALDWRANEAMLPQIINSGFNDNLQALFRLKLKVSQLRYRELNGQKRASDIIDLWDLILKNRRLFGRHIFKVIRNYRVLQRSFPVGMRQARQATMRKGLF